VIHRIEILPHVHFEEAPIAARKRKSPQNCGLCPFSSAARETIDDLATIEQGIEHVHDRVLDDAFRKRRGADYPLLGVLDREEIVRAERKLPFRYGAAQLFQFPRKSPIPFVGLRLAPLSANRFNLDDIEIFPGADVLKKESGRRIPVSRRDHLKKDRTEARATTVSDAVDLFKVRFRSGPPFRHFRELLVRENGVDRYALFFRYPFPRIPQFTEYGEILGSQDSLVIYAIVFPLSGFARRRVLQLFDQQKPRGSGSAPHGVPGKYAPPSVPGGTRWAPLVQGCPIAAEVGKRRIEYDRVPYPLGILPFRPIPVSRRTLNPAPPGRVSAAFRRAATAGSLLSGGTDAALLTNLGTNQTEA